MKLQFTALCAGLVAAASALSYAPRAVANDTNATGYCQSSLPTADVNIRKSPVSIRNQGSSNSFVSCAMRGKDSGAVSVVAVAFTNRTSADIDIDCTMVDGIEPTLATNLGATPTAYYPQTVTIKAVPAGIPDLAIFWDSSTMGVTFSNIVGVTCLLPPGLDMALLEVI